MQERRGAAAVKDLAGMAGVGGKEKSGTSDDSDDYSDDDGEDIIKCLHDARAKPSGNKKASHAEYLVEWVGHPAKDDWTWEPDDHLGDDGRAMIPDLKTRLGLDDLWPRKKRGRKRGSSTTPQQKKPKAKRPSTSAAAASKVSSILCLAS